LNKGTEPPEPKKSNPIKVRSLAKFIQDQSDFEVRRHENCKKIIVEQWTNGEYTYNPALSNKTRKIIEELEAKEAKKEAGESSEERPKFRKTYQPEELTFTPQINERSKQIKRDVTTLVVDAEIRQTKKEKAMKKKATEEAQKSRMEKVKPCSKDS
jgi:DNA-directed RNA polymerase alpha subunit